MEKFKKLIISFRMINKKSNDYAEKAGMNLFKY